MKSEWNSAEESLKPIRIAFIYVFVQHDARLLTCRKRGTGIACPCSTASSVPDQPGASSKMSFIQHPTAIFWPLYLLMLICSEYLAQL